MSMYSAKFARLMGEFPEDIGVVQNLARFLESAEQTRNKPKVFSLERLFDVAGPVSLSRLTRILSALVQLGVLEQIVRVEPEGRGPLQDFAALAEVPDEILDYRRDEMIKVKPDDLRLYYELHR